MLTAIQHASIAAKVRCQGLRAGSSSFSGKPLPIPTLLFLATLGGAQVCNLQERIGSFAVGKDFDALLINVGKFDRNPGLIIQPRSGLVDEKRELSLQLEKFLFCGDDRSISKVWVRGRCVREN